MSDQPLYNVLNITEQLLHILFRILRSQLLCNLLFIEDKDLYNLLYILGQTQYNLLYIPKQLLYCT
jgi:hypothetical protein